ncbi:MAG: PaaI family thioesterase [Dehalococcoidia bacterium]
MTNEEWIRRRLLGEGRVSRFGVLSERLDEAGVAHFEVVCPPEYEGGPGVAHGGWTAAVFDEVLGHVPLLHGHYTVTASLTVEFMRPVPVGASLAATARADRVEGRKWFLSGELALTSSGAVLATASGLWIAREHASHFEGFERWLSEQGAASHQGMGVGEEDLR